MLAIMAKAQWMNVINGLGTSKNKAVNCAG